MWPSGGRWEEKGRDFRVHSDQAVPHGSRTGIDAEGGCVSRGHVAFSSASAAAQEPWRHQKAFPSWPSAPLVLLLSQPL